MFISTLSIYCRIRLSSYYKKQFIGNGMDDILKRQAVKPSKPPRQCCGCGVLEGDEQFLACSKCHELKLFPSLFCSQQCFKNSWKEHKKVQLFIMANIFSACLLLPVFRKIHVIIFFHLVYCISLLKKV